MITPEKYALKQSQLIERTSRALSISLDEASDALQTERQQSVRINTLLSNSDEVTKSIKAQGAAIEPISWMPDGVSVSSGISIIRDSQEAKDGKLYIQNAASWLPVIVLDVKPGDSILDMCAAPGGKTSHIAQLANNECQITANDNSRPRLLKMQANLNRLGVNNIEFSLFDATRLVHRLGEEVFDKIILDAPCSGEGMMNINNKKDLNRGLFY